MANTVLDLEHTASCGKYHTMDKSTLANAFKQTVAEIEGYRTARETIPANLISKLEMILVPDSANTLANHAMKADLLISLLNSAIADERIAVIIPRNLFRRSILRHSQKRVKGCFKAVPANIAIKRLAALQTAIHSNAVSVYEVLVLEVINLAKISFMRQAFSNDANKSFSQAVADFDSVALSGLLINGPLAAAWANARQHLYGVYKKSFDNAAPFRDFIYQTQDLVDKSLLEMSCGYCGQYYHSLSRVIMEQLANTLLHRESFIKASNASSQATILRLYKAVDFTCNVEVTAYVKSKLDLDRLSVTGWRALSKTKLADQFINNEPKMLIAILKSGTAI